MLGHKERDQLELFITGSLRQLIPDEHVLARVDRATRTVTQANTQAARTPTPPFYTCSQIAARVSP